MAINEFRIERDSMGEVRVPAQVYYGAQTQRAVENFAISGIGFPVKFIRALGLDQIRRRPGQPEPRVARCSEGREPFAPRRAKLWRDGTTRNSSSIFFKPAPAHRPT